MKFRSIEKLANLAGKTEDATEKILVQELKKHNVVTGDREYWGYTLGECFDEDMIIEPITDILTTLGIVPYTAYAFTLLLNVVVMGDGDCPLCGGEMEVVDGEYRCVGGDGHLTPKEYVPRWEARRCTACKHYESDEPCSEN